MANSFYQYSFSGTDVKNLCWFTLEDYSQKNASGDPNTFALYNSAPVEIETLTTIAISVHEAKVPFRGLGSKSVRGHASGTRTIAGSLIMSVVNEHPMKALMEQYKKYRALNGSWSYSLDETRDGSGAATSLTSNLSMAADNYYTSYNLLPTILPPFNISLTAVSEIASLTMNSVSVNSTYTNGSFSTTKFPYTHLILFGVEIMDDGIVISNNNPYTEITMSFVAQDYAVLSSKESIFSNSDIVSNTAGLFNNTYALNSETELDDTLTDIVTNSTKYK